MTEPFRVLSKQEFSLLSAEEKADYLKRAVEQLQELTQSLVKDALGKDKPEPK